MNETTNNASLGKSLLMIAGSTAVVFGVAAVFTRYGMGLPITVNQTTTNKMSTFDVSGEGKVVVAPDEASVVMGVRKEGRSIAAVQKSVNETMTGLSKELKSLGIDAKDIQTSSYSFYPDWEDKGLYSAYAQVTVRIRDLDNASAVMGLVGTLGLEQVGGINFGLSDDLQKQSVKEAREKAIDEAKQKASELAGLAGMNLGKIVNISEGMNYPQPYMMRDAVPMAGGGAEKVSTPVEPGSSEIVVNVTLSYETR